MTTDIKILEEPKYQLLIDSMQISKRFKILVFALIVGVSIGLVSEVFQFTRGLSITDLNYRNFWGLYLINFVFFIGIAHAGILISAILRVSNVGWRAPITRMAESISFFALIVGATMVLIDIGQLLRIFNIIISPNWSSPVFWDFVSMSSFLIGALFFLYLPLIPDCGLLRDYYKKKLDNADIKTSTRMLKFRYKIHKKLALNWQGTEIQSQQLDRGIKIMSILFIPITVVAQVIVSLAFSSHWRSGWNSPIFGPNFVIGAIFSGIAGLLITMAIYRKMFKLEDFITPKHFNNLSLILLAFTLIYAGFTFLEYSTATYKTWEEESQIFQVLLSGNYAIPFWSFMIFCFIIPIILLALPQTRHSVAWATTAAVFVNIGMWVKRYLFFIPTLSSPNISNDWLIYNPTLAEISITLAGFCGFLLMIMIFSKLFPIVSIYEEERKKLKTNN